MQYKQLNAEAGLNYYVEKFLFRGKLIKNVVEVYSVQT